MPISHNSMVISVLTTTTRPITLPLEHACWLINVHSVTLKIAVVGLINKVGNKRTAYLIIPSISLNLNGINLQREWCVGPAMEYPLSLPFRQIL